MEHLSDSGCRAAAAARAGPGKKKLESPAQGDEVITMFPVRLRFKTGKNTIGITVGIFS